VAGSTSTVQGIFGGCLLGEVLMFRDYLSDDFRMRLSSQLCAKWLGKANAWEYESVEVAEGSRLVHPYADLLVGELKLDGAIAAKSVRAGKLVLDGGTGAIEGELVLGEGDELSVAYDQESGAIANAAVGQLTVAGRANLKLEGAGRLANLAGGKFKLFGISGKLLQFRVVAQISFKLFTDKVNIDCIKNICRLRNIYTLFQSLFYIRKPCIW
jgi:hypothetical protein